MVALDKQSADIAMGVDKALEARENKMSDEELEALNTTKTELIKTSENAYFRTNFENSSNAVQQGEEQTSFLVGAQFNKKISEANEETGEKEITSKLIIYGENFFISDYQLTKTTQRL